MTLQWEAAYARSFQVQTSTDGIDLDHRLLDDHRHRRHPDARRDRLRPLRADATAPPGPPRYGYSLWEFQVFGTIGGTDPTCGTTNAALNRPATASSAESAATGAAAAVDGNTGTRWSSAFSDPQWIQVDLGSSQTICRVTLQWEARVRDSVPDPGLGHRDRLDHGPLDDDRNRRHAGDHGHRHRPVRPGQRHRAGDRVRLLALGARRRGAPVEVPIRSEPTDPFNPNFGPNVNVFDPSTPTSTIQNRLNTLFTQQETNQFGPQRYAVLFKPGTYTADVNLGFFTQVAGLGMSPDDVNLNGHVRAEAFWMGGNATQNFWRSAENLSVTLPAGVQVERWAVSQAAPYRRMHLRGAGNQIQLWNGGDGWSSGGFMADTKIDGLVVSGSQQQWYSRNSEFGGWTGSVWNMVFQGVAGAPPPHFPNPSHTVIANTPTVREKPFLYVTASGEYRVFVPALRAELHRNHVVRRRRRPDRRSR